MTEVGKSSDCVGVVIPTRGRPSLVVRAVCSVLAQTHRRLEIAVVVDGPDSDTVAALSAINDARLGVHVIEPSGAAAARNAGVRLVNGTWVAFLDDDDTWHPTKLERQLAVAGMSGEALPIVTCRTRKVGHGRAVAYPERLPDDGESVSEYLFAPRLPMRRGGAQTSTLLVPRVLMLQCGFDEALPRHQDWDWLLRASRIPGARLIAMDDVLAEWHMSPGAVRISGSRNWRYSLEWIRSRRALVTPRAYSGFLLTVVPVSAARGGARSADFRRLLKEAIGGRPDALQLLVFLAWWVMPDRLIRWSGRRLSRLYNRNSADD